MISFTDLATEFLSNSTLQDIWGYRRPGFPDDTFRHVINQTACEALVGTGSEYYNWADAANTINTWVLPFTGLLLQAPFDSNNARGTAWAISRWVGGSMASLSYILWNMRSSANCAALLDKATRREHLPAEYEIDEEDPKIKRRSDFASYRDAFFLLSVMNQYTVNVKFNGASAEKLIKVALFSKDLKLPVAAGGEIEDIRKALARDTREARKRGTVQCFLSQLWFVFGMVISIQQSFGLMGQDAPAQNLALGLAMVWFPVLMLCTVVDRNPAIPESTQRQLNTFLTLVRTALLRDARRYREKHEIFHLRRNNGSSPLQPSSPIKPVTFVEALSKSPTTLSSLASYEEDSSAKIWFESAECDTPDLKWLEAIADQHLDEVEFFDKFAGQGRHMWHYGVAYPIVTGLKDDGIIDARRGWMYDTNVREKLISTSDWERKDRLHSWDLREFWQVLASLLIVWTSMLGGFLISYFTPTVGLGCRSLGYLVFSVICTGQGMVEMLVWAITPHHLHHTKFYQRTRFLGSWFISLSEVVNTFWLLYIIFAQALGSYNTCKCKCSNYGLGGGFIDLRYVLGHGPIGNSLTYWIAATTMGCSVLALSFAFIAWEWVTQSHISTENYDEAMKGLKTTRRFKKWTRCIAPLQA